MKQAEAYTKTAVLLHWMIAILMIFLLFPGGEFMEVPRGASLGDWQPTAHASLGALVLILSVIRLGWRLAHPPPPLPPMPAYQATASHAVHIGFYVLMIGLPLTGWLALSPYAAARVDGEMVSFFQLFPMAIMPNLGGWTMDAHELLGDVAKVLLALHVFAALYHQFWKREGMLARMWFGKRSANS